MQSDRTKPYAHDDTPTEPVKHDTAPARLRPDEFRLNGKVVTTIAIIVSALLIIGTVVATIMIRE